MPYFLMLPRADDHSFASARVSLAWAALAFALLLVWQFLNVRYNHQGNWTALFLAGHNFPPPPNLAPGTYQVPGSGYDGQFYRYVAHDPLLRHGTQQYLDGPTQRYRRILVPALAFVLAAGQQPWIDGAYIAVIAIFVLAGAYWLSRWCVLHRYHPAWGLAFLLVPATLISMDRMTVDVALTSLTVAAAYYWETESWPRLYGVLVLACLTRETGILLVAGCCIFEFFHKRFARAVIWASSALPMLAWYLFLRRSLDTRRESGAPRLYLWDNHPSLFGRILHPPRYPLPAAQETLARSLDVLAIVALLGVLVAAVWLMRIRPAGPMAISALLFAAVAFALSGHYRYWEDCNEYARVFSPLMILIAVPWLTRQSGSRVRWLILLLPLLIDLRLGVQYVSQVGGVMRGLLRL
jgi:hypothetical protein